MIDPVKIQFGRDALTWSRVVTQSGALVSLSSNAPIWSIQNTATDRALWIRGVWAQFVATVAPTTAQQINLGAYIARSFSVADSGGTTVAFAAGTTKLRSNYSDPSGISIRYSNATGAITAGTRTLDANAVGMVGAWVPNPIVGGAVIPMQALVDTDSPEPSIILGPNEGLVINSVNAFGAALAGVATITAEIIQVRNPYV